MYQYLAVRSPAFSYRDPPLHFLSSSPRIPRPPPDQSQNRRPHHHPQRSPHPQYWLPQPHHPLHSFWKFVYHILRSIVLSPPITSRIHLLYSSPTAFQSSELVGSKRSNKSNFVSSLVYFLTTRPPTDVVLAYAVTKKNKRIESDRNQYHTKKITI